MAQSDKRKVRALISKADSHQQGVLLANHYAEHWLRRTPLLMSGEIADIARQMRPDATRYKGKDSARSHNSEEIAHMLQAEYNLCFCLSDAKVAYLEVMQSLTVLDSHLTVIAMNHFAKKGLRQADAALNKEVVEELRHWGGDELAALGERSLEKSDSAIGADEDAPDRRVAPSCEVIELAKKQVAHLKALLQVMRDAMESYAMPILVFNERIDWYEQHVREFIRGTKRIFYDALFPEWETEKASILQRGDQYALMLECLPDYDDVPFDDAVYNDVWSFVKSQTLGFTHPS
ncbi:MAG: hypothetical protein WCE82_07465 [Halobacteriota archaeon]